MARSSLFFILPLCLGLAACGSISVAPPSESPPLSETVVEVSETSREQESATLYSLAIPWESGDEVDAFATAPPPLEEISEVPKPELGGVWEDPDGGTGDQGSSGQGETPQPGEVQSSSEARIQAAVNMVLNLSFGLVGDGSQPDPRALTGGGREDRWAASQTYINLRESANRIGANAGNPKPPSTTNYYGHCSGFLATVIINTLDPLFPGNLTETQRAYVNSSPKWVKVGSSLNFDPSLYKAGDIFQTDGAEYEHTYMWIGNYGGLTNIVAEASYGSAGSKTAHLPALSKVNIEDDGRDHRGRSYSIWRFVG